MVTAATDVDGQPARPTSAKLIPLSLIALVVGSMIGGVFDLPLEMSKAAAPGTFLGKVADATAILSPLSYFVPTCGGGSKWH